MLFDLRGRGRRRVIQVIYLGLAVLMGGGLVIFGIGGNTSGGGLFDAFSGGGNTATTSSYTKQIESAQKQVDANPKNAAAWARLASLRLAQGGANGGFEKSPEGVKDFRRASAAWDRYLALEPAKVNQSVARQMINVYGSSGLNLPDKAVGAMDLIIDQTEPPEADLYKQYALLAFTAGQARKGDLAIDKAVSLSPAAERKELRSALESLKGQAAAAAAGVGAPGAPGGTQTAPVG